MSVLRCRLGVIANMKLVLAILATLAAQPAVAGCQSELRLLADDLQGAKLSDQRNQEIAGVILQARRHCWVQQEKPAMDLINRARMTAGLKPATGEFDWENVPLDSLEPDSPRSPPVPDPLPSPQSGEGAK